MAIPQRVRDEAAEAERQMAQIQNGVQPTNPPAPETPTGDDTPPREPDSQFGTHQEVQNLEGGDPPSNGSGPIDAEAFARLQQQMATLQGNFSRQATELTEARTRTEMLERMLARQVEERPAVPATPAPAAPVSSVTDAEIDEYGADLTDFMKRLIRDATQGTFTQILDQLQKITSSLTETSGMAQAAASTSAQTVYDKYVERMNRLVTDAKGEPDWEAINTMHERGDNRFVDWLYKTGEDSDEPRLNVIRRAFAARDADRCARMINNFKRDVGMPDGTKAVEDPTDTPAARAAALVSPSTTGSGSGAPRGRPPAKTYTTADINRHYEEKTKGKWKGKEAEWQKIADDMDKAVVEQRYTVEPRNPRGR